MYLLLYHLLWQSQEAIRWRFELDMTWYRDDTTKKNYKRFGVAIIVHLMSWIHLVRTQAERSSHFFELSLLLIHTFSGLFLFALISTNFCFED